MLSHLQYGSLMLLKLQVFLLDLVDRDTDDVDHISKDSCSYYLNHGHNNGLNIIVGSEIAIANSHHGCVGPIVRVNVVNVPRFVC